MDELDGFLGDFYAEDGALEGDAGGEGVFEGGGAEYGVGSCAVAGQYGAEEEHADVEESERGLGVRREGLEDRAGRWVIGMDG